MITKPHDILNHYPVRKTKKQKQRFRDSVMAYANTLGYDCKVEKGSFGSCNVIIGDPVHAKHLITAHYDTCAALPFPNLITPCNPVLLILYAFFLTVVLLLAPIVVSVVVYFLTNSFVLAYYLFYVFVLLTVAMILIGPANRNNVNDNTSGVIAALEIARSVPQIHRETICIVLFDLEEAGLIGSASYAKTHKNSVMQQLVWNIDCVGDGDHIVLFPTAKLKKRSELMEKLYRCTVQLGKKEVVVRDRGFAFYPSDQANFPLGVGIAAMHKSIFGYWLGRIHTRRDTVLDETNVNILRAAIVSAIVCDAG